MRDILKRICPSGFGCGGGGAEGGGGAKKIFFSIPSGAHVPGKDKRIIPPPHPRTFRSSYLIRIRKANLPQARVSFADVSPEISAKEKKKHASYYCVTSTSFCSDFDCSRRAGISSPFLPSRAPEKVSPRPIPDWKSSEISDSIIQSDRETALFHFLYILKNLQNHYFFFHFFPNKCYERAQMEISEDAKNFYYWS